jgi:glycosyltransferase involved in cell wall biosynthesis
MNSAPSISVVMPVYHEDVAEHFDLALESLSSQTLRANEILVVKDGPLTDALDDVLQRWIERDSSMKVVELKTNQGLSAALNAGIDAANYDWIARMDADDICRAQRFDKQWSLIQDDPELAILGSWIMEYDEDMNEEVGLRKLPEMHNEILRFAKWRCPFNHMTVMYKTSVIRELGKYKNYGAVGDDYELWARFLVNGHKSANLQEVLVDPRTGKDFFGNRRRGLKYLRNEIKEISDLKELGLINSYQWFVHTIVKTFVRLSPTWMVKWVYKGLRKS